MYDQSRNIPQVSTVSGTETMTSEGHVDVIIHIHIFLRLFIVLDKDIVGIEVERKDT
jgi:hypothetical protein